MMVTAQIGIDAFAANAEGVFYTYGCETCPLVAVGYQAS